MSDPMHPKVNLELKSALLATSAVQSLDMERHIVNLLRKRNWPATQSYFYRDRTTGKLRELDVQSMRVFELTTRFGGPLTRVNLAFECKSNADYSLIFSREREADLEYLTTFAQSDLRFTPGEEGFLRYLFAQRLPHYERIFTQDVLRSMMSFSYPDESLRVAAAFVRRLPSLPFITTSFREAKPKAEREVEASVLWSATQSLMSFVQAEHQRLKDLYTGRVLPPKETFPPGSMTKSRLVHAYAMEALTTDYFHPIVVTRSLLWLRDAPKGRLDRIPWVRLYVSARDAPFVCDVVHYDAIDRYVKMVTSHYETEVTEGLIRIQGQEQYEPEYIADWIKPLLTNN